MGGSAFKPQSPQASGRGPSAFSLRGGRSMRGLQPLPNVQSRAVEREEERQREQLYLDAALAAQALDSESLHHSTATFRRSVAGMEKSLVALRDETAAARTTQQQNNAAVMALTGQVASLGHVLGLLSDVHTESVKAQMMELSVAKGVLERRCQDLQVELELERGHKQALQATLRATLARSKDQVEELRDEVRARIAAEAIDLQQLRRDLQYRCDAAAATVQVMQPTPTANFDARLRALQECVAETNKLVEGRFALLRQELDSIRVSPQAAEAMSLHSNIPSVFRTELANFSNDELLTLLDALSFEPGVVAALSSAVAAKRRRV